MMHTRIVKSEEEFEAAVTANKAAGYEVACVSNTGLPQGQWRVTFLPAEAFKSDKSVEVSA